ncbi:ATP-binding cassette domain-containing protein [Auraticoccus sp. F435]|uniref:ATP-binding cassette domain-containing protein n=1 Tax=Auraticoccus cholistanensis TaxID=2656650 RepID=A0A6A9UNT4_9ACTN|nr:ATP-binding cassette domain-containing protein [Auraticoccus cholistanensis]MVA74526.1 ATP-binding cassette domain-containing protein [Auraticoccus cholistanensis]
MDTVTTTGLTKSYGRQVVVQGLDLRVPEGCVYGFLGPNGSGKSTTMKMLLSLVRPTAGEVLVLGEPMNRSTRRRQLARIGSLIESPPGYGHLTGGENLRLVQRSLGLDEAQVDRAVRSVRLEEQLDKKVAHYSLGMKQRLGIAMALAREPRLLVLDEPTNGLDPAGIEEIRELLRRLAGRGVTVMVSSHLLGEVDKAADVFGILSAGRLLFQGSREQLFAAAVPDLLIDTSDPHRARAVLDDRVAARVDGGSLRIPGIDDQGTARVVADLVGAGAPVYGVRREEQSLEDVFMDLTRGGRL